MNRRSRLPALASLLGLALIWAAVYLIRPDANPWTPACPFRWLTGLYCPGCGTFRGLHALAHGNLAGAWRCNPLMVLALPVLGYSLATLVTRRLPPIELSGRASWAIVAVVILFWVARNIPVYPLSLLAPH